MNPNPDITLNFKGHATLEEIYQIHVKSYRSALILVCGTNSYDDKVAKRREILELLSIMDNALFTQKYPKLARKPRIDDFLNRRKKIAPKMWGLDIHGNRIEEDPKDEL